MGNFLDIQHIHAFYNCLQIVHLTPCYQFIWNDLLSPHLYWSEDKILLKWIHQEKNRLTVKHACAYANLLRLLLRHIYLIRLNQHRVVMIKHFSPISVWERRRQGVASLLKGLRGKSASISQRFSTSVCLALSPSPCVPLFLFLFPCSPLSAFPAAFLCISRDTS